MGTGTFEARGRARPSRSIRWVAASFVAAPLGLLAAEAPAQARSPDNSGRMLAASLVRAEQVAIGAHIDKQVSKDYDDCGGHNLFEYVGQIPREIPAGCYDLHMRCFNFRPGVPLPADIAPYALLNLKTDECGLPTNNKALVPIVIQLKTQNYVGSGRFMLQFVERWDSWVKSELVRDDKIKGISKAGNVVAAYGWLTVRVEVNVGLTMGNDMLDWDMNRPTDPAFGINGKNEVRQCATVPILNLACKG